MSLVAAIVRSQANSGGYVEAFSYQSFHVSMLNKKGLEKNGLNCLNRREPYDSIKK